MDSWILHLFDAALIAPFRWFSPPEAGFVVGILLLCVYSVGLGRLGADTLARVQRPLSVKHEAEAARRSDLAMQALLHQNKDAYLAQNRLAKDAYGHSTALAVGRVTASLCPAVAALAWLDLRFRDVPLALPVAIPGLGDTVRYPFYFIPAYFAVRLLWHALAQRSRRS